MLNHLPQSHLSHDELLQALVDVADLEPRRQSHLGQCVSCQKALDRLEQRFGRLGRMARQMAPAPSRPFRLPQKAVPQARWRFKPIWATGVVAAMILALSLWWPRLFAPTGPVQHLARQNRAADAALLDQVDALIDNALPPVLQQLAVVPQLDDADSVMNWVVPPVDEMEDDDTWT